MSYTLRGRIETRLAASLAPFLVAAALAPLLGAWWPLQLAAAMIAVGLALDATLYHRLLPYQPGWAALPLGLVELGLTMALVWRLDVEAPLRPALWFFTGSWLLAQVLGHAVLPTLHLTYTDDGGELGRGGHALSAAAPAALLAVLGVAWAAEPPVVHLDGGTIAGPLVLDSPQVVEGGGAIVRGGILIRSDDVTVRDVTVFGGEIGIEVRDSEDVVLEGVRVAGAALDGISARRSSLVVRDCEIDSPGVAGAQGIDISFAMTLPPSRVERCVVRGGSEGIVSHLAMVDFRENRVSGTSLRGIAVTEMSMGSVDRNVVEDATGVGIFCGDWSHCSISENSVTGTRADPSGNPTRAGHGIVSHYYAVAELDDNQLDHAAEAFIHGRFDDLE
jgi:hypothetical protein